MKAVRQRQTVSRSRPAAGPRPCRTWAVGVVLVGLLLAADRHADTLDGHDSADFALTSQVPSLSLTGEHSITRSSSSGTSYVMMVSTTRSMCHLAGILLEEVDAGG